MTGREILIYLSCLEGGDWEKIYDDIKDKKSDMNSEDVKNVISSIKSKVVTILDEDYPEHLKHMYKPPFVLYYYGDLSLIKSDRNCVAVIGSRDSTEYGERMTRLITSDLCRSLNIVSGMARGIDAVAHQTAINCKGKTIAVLGSGIDNCYPKENSGLYEQIKSEHLVISEYPANNLPDKSHFPFRNRLIAALSRCVVVTEANEKSGTSITIGYALARGSDVCCVPYPAGGSSFCNHLIKEGAKLTETAFDVFEEMGFAIPKDVG